LEPEAHRETGIESLKPTSHLKIDGGKAITVQVSGVGLPVRVFISTFKMLPETIAQKDILRKYATLPISFLK